MTPACKASGLAIECNDLLDAICHFPPLRHTAESSVFWTLSVWPRGRLPRWNPAGACGPWTRHLPCDGTWHSAPSMRGNPCWAALPVSVEDEELLKCAPAAALAAFRRSMRVFFVEAGGGRCQASLGRLPGAIASSVVADAVEAVPVGSVVAALAAIAAAGGSAAVVGCFSVAKLAYSKRRHMGEWVALLVKDGKAVGRKGLLLWRGMCIIASASSPFPSACRRCFGDNIQAIGAERL